MLEIKTKQTTHSVVNFIEGISDETKRSGTLAIFEIIKKVTGEEPAMWGDSIIGFGKYSYKGSGNRCGEWFPVGISSRKNNLVIYLALGFEQYQPLLEHLGKFKTGKGCIYINKLTDINLTILEQLISEFYHNFKG